MTHHNKNNSENEGFTCTTEEERILFCEKPQSKKNIILELFCPGDSCEVVEPTKLP
jgi:hypothetical protein